MPALKLFGRKWLAATDDMVFPCLFELIVRVVWLILMGVITHRYYSYTFTCTAGGECVRVYLLGMLTLLSFNVVLLLAIINRSGQGGICDVHARRLVPPLLAVKILLLLPEAGWNVLGTIWAFTSVINCPADDHFTNTAIDVLVCLDWLLFALLVFALAMVIDPIGSIKLRTSQPDLNLDTLKNRQVVRTWIRRFRWFFCWLNRDKDSLEAFAQVAGLMSSMFRDSDLVPSDLIAGCVLLRVKQKRESREQWRLELMAEQRLKYKSDLRDVFRGKPDWMRLERALQYMRLSIAIYGCAFVVYKHCCTGICRLIRHSTCCACFRHKKALIEGDNCCLCYMAGLKELSDITEEAVIYANFKNRIFEVPYCIISDHKTESIVVSIRGTLSLRDIFTDLVAAPEKIEVEGLPENSMAHKGILNTAKKLKHHLEETKILDKALSTYPNYDLIFTGHSLGAGTAILLGLLYRPTYPDLKVYAFSSPCVLSRAAAVYCESFVFTLGVGDDFAMRTSSETIENLRAQLFDVLQNCRLPKYRVIVNGFGYALFGVPSRHLNTTWRDDRPTPQPTVMLPAPNSVPYIFALEENGTQQMSNLDLLSVVKPSKSAGNPNCTLADTAVVVGYADFYKKSSSSPEAEKRAKMVTDSWGIAEVATRRYSNISLFPAGSILHIVYKKKNKEERSSSWHFSTCLCCCNKKKKTDDKTYEMRWLSPEYFEELRVMPRMLLDHFPDNVHKVLNTILDEQETEIEDNAEFIM